MQRLTVNAKFATVQGSIPASSDTVEFEGRQMLIKVLNPPLFHNKQFEPLVEATEKQYREYINIEN